MPVGVRQGACRRSDPDTDAVVREKEAYRGRPQPDFATVVGSLDDMLDKTLTFDRRVPLWKE